MPKLSNPDDVDRIRKERITAAAQDYYERGLWVVPTTRDKKPVVKYWPDTRVSPDELELHLNNGRPLNIAIALNQSDYIDVECDSEEEEAALQAMFDNNIPPTPTWQSSRGNHRLFRRPDGLPKKATIVLDDIEFHIASGSGKLATVPPSIHAKTNKPYKWVDGLSLDDVEPAELPAVVAERLRADSTAKTISGKNERIPEGKRNDTLFKKAVALVAAKMDEKAIAAALLSVNEQQCDPPLTDDEVRAIAKSAATQDPKVGFIDRLLGEVDLWHDQNDDPFATLPQSDHRENWLIGKRTRQFKRWLSKLYYDATRQILKAGDLADLVAMLEGRAVFDGPQFHLYRRTAQHENKFYLDLCDDQWRAVEIDADGYRVVADPPVKFRRAPAMTSLPIPLTTKNTDLYEILAPFLNLREDQWPLVGAWLAASIRPVGPYPILKILGEQGSAKTTTARVLRSVIDPNEAPVRAEPRSTRDLVISANNAWVLCLDNLSVVKPDLSDALCRLSTGGGFATRALYTDADETIFDAMRPIILTSIEEIGTRSDLLERSLIIELPTIREGKRRAEKQFWVEFEKVRPRVLGALLDVVSSAMRRLPDIEAKSDTNLSRMADFCQWGEACEESLGLAPGTFAEAYEANQAVATQIVLGSNPLITALMKFLSKKPGREHKFTAQEWLEKLGWVDSALQSQPGWPKTARVLSAILKRAAPNLRTVGITALQDTSGGGNTKVKVWRITGPTVASKTTTKTTAKTKPTKKVAKTSASNKKSTNAGRKDRTGSKTPSKLSRSIERAKANR